MSVAHPALKYFGSKWLLAPWVTEHLPEHHCYVEVFGGSAGVLLRKPRSTQEVYNDIDGEVVNFFEVLRNRTEELERAVALTPYSREEFVAGPGQQGDDPLERARRYYIQSWQSYGGVQARQKGWSFCFRQASSRSRVREWVRTEHLADVAARLRGVQIESGTWAEVLDRYDSPATVFYLDPPYLPQLRSNRYDAAYRFEFSESDHVDLLGRIIDLEAMVLISGYASPIYDDVLAGWRRVGREARAQSGGSRTEVLWLSPNCRTSAAQAWLGL